MMETLCKAMNHHPMSIPSLSYMHETLRVAHLIKHIEFGNDESLLRHFL